WKTGTKDDFNVHAAPCQATYNDSCPPRSPSDRRQSCDPQDGSGQTQAREAQALSPSTSSSHSASWLNMIERFFAEITQKRIRRGVFKSESIDRRLFRPQAERVTYRRESRRTASVACDRSRLA